MRKEQHEEIRRRKVYHRVRQRIPVWKDCKKLYFICCEYVAKYIGCDVFVAGER